MKFLNYFFSVALCAFVASATSLSAADVNVMNYGAKQDTTVLSTKAIQKAIDACAASGGGYVNVPSGSYKIGSIFLKDNVYLNLAPGAVIYGSTKVKDYTPVKPAFLSLRTGIPTIQLIYGEGLHNTGICGKGTIDGQGRHFIKRKTTDEGIERPHLIRFVSCDGVKVEDVTLRDSGCWMQHYLACDNVYLRGLNIFNRATKNNDAVDIDGCHNVVISDLICDTDDDGITLKSTSPRLTENVVISNCVVSSHCNAIKLGTETNGGFRNISISNCVVKPSEVPGLFFGYEGGISGVSLEMVDGGILDGVTVSNIMIRGTQVPIFIRLGNRARSYAENVSVDNIGQLKNVSISNLRAVEAGNVGCSITGMPGHPVENILLRDIYIETVGNPDPSKIVAEPEELEKGYPEATMFGLLPCSGFFVRHAANVRFENVNISTSKPDPRPTFKYEDVK